MQKNNLLIFITPTIVQDADFRLANTDFLQSQPQNHGGSHEHAYLVGQRQAPRRLEQSDSAGPGGHAPDSLNGLNGLN